MTEDAASEEHNLHEETITVWRDYDRGKVGYQSGDKPRMYFTPDEARFIADKTERDFNQSEFSTHPQRERLLRILNDIRDYADELDRLGEDSDD